MEVRPYLLCNVEMVRHVQICQSMLNRRQVLFRPSFHILASVERKEEDEEYCSG